MKNGRAALVGQLDKLGPDISQRGRTLLTNAEAAAIIRAIRRGVATTAVDKTSGWAHGTVYTRLGRWAMRKCQCFEKIEEGK